MEVTKIQKMKLNKCKTKTKNVQTFYNIFRDQNKPKNEKIFGVYERCVFVCSACMLTLFSVFLCVSLFLCVCLTVSDLQL